MTGGKAYGADRVYQELCRDVLRKNDPALVPAAGDGADVPFDAAGSTWSFDVALHVPFVRLVVAECRRRRDPVEQEDLAAFAFRVDRLRHALGLPVAGVFFAKRHYRVGAVRAAQFEGISMAVVADGETVRRRVCYPVSSLGRVIGEALSRRNDSSRPTAVTLIAGGRVRVIATPATAIKD